MLDDIIFEMMPVNYFDKAMVNYVINKICPIVMFNMKRFVFFCNLKVLLLQIKNWVSLKLVQVEKSMNWSIFFLSFLLLHLIDIAILSYIMCSNYELLQKNTIRNVFITSHVLVAPSWEKRDDDGSQAYIYSIITASKRNYILHK